MFVVGCLVMEFGACGHILESLLDITDALALAEVLLEEAL